MTPILTRSARWCRRPLRPSHELYLDAHGNLYGEHSWYEGERTNNWGHYVWKRDAAGRVSTIRPRTEGFLTNYSFVRDAAGNMYWPQRDRWEIRKRAPNGAIARVVGELKGMSPFIHATPPFHAGGRGFEPCGPGKKIR